VRWGLRTAAVSDTAEPVSSKHPAGRLGSCRRAACGWVRWC